MEGELSVTGTVDAELEPFWSEIFDAELEPSTVDATEDRDGLKID